MVKIRRGEGVGYEYFCLISPPPPPSTLQIKHGTIDYTMNFLTLTRSNETPAFQAMLHYVVFTGLKVKTVNSVNITTSIQVASVFQVNEKARLVKNFKNPYDKMSKMAFWWTSKLWSVYKGKVKFYWGNNRRKSKEKSYGLRNKDADKLGSMRRHKRTHRLTLFTTKKSIRITSF